VLRFESWFEKVAAGLPACRKGRHPAARKNSRHDALLGILKALKLADGFFRRLEARLYVSQDG